MYTANNMYNYTMDYKGSTLMTWVLRLYQHIECLNKNNAIIAYGTLSFDNLALSMASIFEKDITTITVLDICEILHKTQVTNYHYWNENKPWLLRSTLYKNPENNNKLYKKCSQCTDFFELSSSRRLKIGNIARGIYTIINTIEESS
jgi:hypothetical protein